MRKFVLSLWLALAVLIPSYSYALDGTGTVMGPGKLEVDVTINPFESVTYGQNFAYAHYGLGNLFEVNGYVSKWGTITNWNDSTYEIYMGVMKQWATVGPLDLSTAVGLRKVLRGTDNFSLIGPGVLYAWHLSPVLRLAGHFQYIGELKNSAGLTLGALNQGFTHEIGFYYRVAFHLELAAGIFTNSQGTPRPIYSFNFYL